MSEDKKKYNGIIVMVCNIVIMIANYVINLFSKPDSIAYIFDKMTSFIG